MSEIIVKVEGGYLRAVESGDNDYLGIDVEFIPNETKDESLSTPRVLFEKPVGGKLRILVWTDKDNEDYTQKIEFY